MIGDILVVVILMLLCYKPVLWVARRLVQRSEGLIEEVEKGIPKPKEPKMKEKDNKGQANIEVIAVGVVLFLGFVLLLDSWVTIPQGTVGVVFNRAAGGVQAQTLGEGWHTRMPFTTMIQKYPVALRTYNALGIGEGADKASNALDLPTAEGQHIQQDISIVYNVMPDKASFVFDKFRGADIEDIEATFIRRLVTSVANNVAGRYSIMDIYGPKKQVVQKEIYDTLKIEMEKWGFNVDRVNLGAAKFPETIEASLQAKVAAQQTAETAKFKLQQAEIDKQATIAAAQGQAQANELIQASLSPKLVNLKWIEKWNGELPTYMMGNGTGVLITPKDNQ